jgi:aerobic carbon-monoxide dehydrogenase medium subunit
MKSPPFAYARPETLAEAFALLTDPEAKALAGGQSLLASLAFRLSQPSTLVDIGRLSELSGVALFGDRLRIGALTTHAQLTRASLIRQHAPLLADAAALIAHPAIRNRGTIGGSLAYADPAAELPACVVALDATIVVVSAKAERRIAAADFFTGLLSTALGDGELIAAVEVPIGTSTDRTSIIELARRSGDYAMAGAVVKLAMDGVQISRARIVMFGVGERPVLADCASAALVGQVLSAVSIESAQTALDDDLDPPADQHGSPEMKRHLAKVVLGRGLNKILAGPA